MNDIEAINRYLGERGLGQLSDTGLPAQLGFMVRDHAHFGSLLACCDPMLRRGMYEALRSNLRFEAKPLDVYVSEAQADAERRQLPVIGRDGMLEPYRAPEITGVTDDSE